MTDYVRLTKLIDRIQHLISFLESERDFAIHQHVDQFYYMQKVVELNELREQLEKSRKRASLFTEVLEREYACVFSHWRQDLRWLSHHHLQGH